MGNLDFTSSLVYKPNTAFWKEETFPHSGENVRSKYSCVRYGDIKKTNLFVSTVIRLNIYINTRLSFALAKVFSAWLPSTGFSRLIIPICY